MTEHAPADDLFRGIAEAPTLRDDAADESPGTGSYMTGHFSTFDQWYEIDSWFEGQFLERIAAGAFTKTIQENRDSVVVQFDHGYDLHVGDNPLGPIEELHEDDTGPFYGVPLLDTDYNRNRILPLLRGRTMDGRDTGSLLGASFRFRVTKDEWVEPERATSHNPDKIKERTIREVRLYEFGPVVFPANPAATAGVRSLSDHYIGRRLEREGRAERAARELAPNIAAALGTASNEPPRHSSAPGPAYARTLATLHGVNR